MNKIISIYIIIISSVCYPQYQNEIKLSIGAGIGLKYGFTIIAAVNYFIFDKIGTEIYVCGNTGMFGAGIDLNVYPFENNKIIYGSSGFSWLLSDKSTIGWNIGVGIGTPLFFTNNQMNLEVGYSLLIFNEKMTNSIFTFPFYIDICYDLWRLK